MSRGGFAAITGATDGALDRKFAFGHDDVTPVSKSFTDGRNGWGASIVDAMSTLVCVLHASIPRSVLMPSLQVIMGEHVSPCLSAP